MESGWIIRDHVRISFVEQSRVPWKALIRWRLLNALTWSSLMARYYVRWLVRAFGELNTKVLRRHPNVTKGQRTKTSRSKESGSCIWSDVEWQAELFWRLRHAWLCHEVRLTMVPAAPSCWSGGRQHARTGGKVGSVGETVKVEWSDLCRSPAHIDSTLPLSRAVTQKPRFRCQFVS